MSKEMKKYLLVYFIVYALLGSLDVHSTGSALSMGYREANPTVSNTNYLNLFSSEVLYCAIGLLSLFLAIKWKKKLDSNDPLQRSFFKFLSNLNRSPGNPWPLIFLLAALLLLWVKLTGAISNYLLAFRGEGLYDIVRSMFSGFNESTFYWFFTIGNDLLFLALAGLVVFVHWKKKGSILGDVK